jgi:NAD(P)-dependent dehydrogenase (short-subunit alcohol dehydrogenase family)
MSDRLGIVLGAGGELGRATVAALAKAGLTIVAVDRSEASMDVLPGEVHRVVADATDPSVAQPLVDRIANESGPPDVLVNTIGAFVPADALETTPELLRSMVDVNIGPAFWFTAAVARHMRQRKSGSIVHITARPGLDPTGGMAAYSASKAALVHLVKVLDVELRPSGIRVNGVAPQLLDTPINRSILPDEMLAQAIAPEAIAAIIAFLVSDAAAPISGAILPAYG